MQSLDRRVPLLAYKQPGAESHLSGTNALSPLTQGGSRDCQDGQHGGSISYKPPRGFKVAHPGQACMLPCPLGPRQAHLPESGSCSGSLEPRSRFSVETEAQIGGMDAEPPNSSPDLVLVRQGGDGPLCVTGVGPMPTLVLPKFPSTSGH